MLFDNGRDTANAFKVRSIIRNVRQKEESSGRVQDGLQWCKESPSALRLRSEPEDRGQVLAVGERG